MIEILFAGLGGQGIVLSAAILANAAAQEGYYAAQSQSYGSESRGTPSKAEVVFSKSFIDFPHVEYADYFIAMAEKSYLLLKRKAGEKSTIFYDGSIFQPEHEIRGADYININASALSIEKLSKPLYANIIILGALTYKIKEYIPYESIKSSIEKVVPNKALSQNFQAFALGHALMEATKTDK